MDCNIRFRDFCINVMKCFYLSGVYMSALKENSHLAVLPLISSQKDLRKVCQFITLH